MEQSEKDNEWIGKEEINSIYTDAISTNYRKDAIRISFGQITSVLVEEKRRIKIVQSVTTDPHTFKHVILENLNNILKRYEEEYGEIGK